MIQRRNILLIDPSDKFASQLQLMLFTNSATGSVHLVSTMQEAAQLLCSDHFDLIITSIPFDARVGGLLADLKEEVSSVQVIQLQEEPGIKIAGVVDHSIDKSQVFREVPKIISQMS